MLSKFIKPLFVLLLGNALFLSGCSTIEQKYPINQIVQRVDIKHSVSIQPAPISTPLLKASLLTEKATSPDSKKIEIYFAPGDYNQPNNDDIQKLQTALVDAKTVVVTGYSKSTTTLATQELAFRRAKVVADTMNTAAVIRTQWDNNQSKVGNYPGVIVTISYAENPPKPTTDKISSVSSVEKTDPSTVKKEVKPVGLYRVDIQAGSLRANLMRIIEDHNHTLGGWGFGDADTEIDWIIPKAFHYDIDDNLADILASVTDLYGVQCSINNLDKTVDFHTEVNGE